MIVFDPWARLEHCIQIAFAAKPYTDTPTRGSLALLPQSIEFFNEGILANGVSHLYAQRPTIIIYRGPENGIIDIGHQPILWRTYHPKPSDFPFLNTLPELQREMPRHLDILLSYLQILKNIHAIAVLQVNEQGIEILENVINQTIIKKYNLIFLSDLHQQIKAEQWPEKDNALLEQIRTGTNHHDLHTFPIIQVYTTLAHQQKMRIINEQYINTWILGLNKDSVSGYCCINMQLL